MKLRNLLLAVALAGAALLHANAQAFVVPTASFTPVATGNSVWVTKSDAGQPTGSIYARGYTEDWSTVVNFYALGGTTVLWQWQDNHLFITSFASGFPQTGMYLCPPHAPGYRLAIQASTLLGASAAVGQGGLRAPLGYSLIVPNYGPNGGWMEFPASTIQQVRFRVVAY